MNVKNASQKEQKNRIAILLKGYFIIILFAFAPIISMLIASGIASYIGCDINEGSVQECLLWGKDIGHTLYIMFVSAWYMFFTIPIGGLIFIGWTAYWGVRINKRT